MRSALAALLAVVGLFASALGHAQALYKYVDDKGRVTYSNDPPGPEEKRTVTLMTPAGDTNVIQGPQRSATTQRIAAKLEARDAQIDKLRADIDAAKKRLADAEAARDGGGEMLEDERQWTLSRPDPGAKPDKDGRLPGRDGKVMCQIRTGPDGVIRPYCPSLAVPNEAYYERQNRLSQAVTDARRTLDEAIESFRRTAPE